MKRIIDANLNRGTEALRVLEEISRFVLNDAEISKELKYIRHELNSLQEGDYDRLLAARDTENDVGTVIQNPDKRAGIETIFKANMKRLQQVLRVLEEYAGVENLRYKTYTLEKTMWEKLKSDKGIFSRRLYLVTDSGQFSNDSDFLDAVASALKGGVDIIQLREKADCEQRAGTPLGRLSIDQEGGNGGEKSAADGGSFKASNQANSSASRIIELGRTIKLLCAEYNALFIVNDRVDIAYILEADGVHLGQDDIDVASARKILGNNAIIGVSTHAPEQALKAVEDGADYIGVGPVFTTPTKPGRQSVGLDYVKWVSENIDIPAFAIGGIDLTNVQEVVQAGAHRIAVVRAIINAKSPEKAAGEFHTSLRATAKQSHSRSIDKIASANASQ